MQLDHVHVLDAEPGVFVDLPRRRPRHGLADDVDAGAGGEALLGVRGHGLGGDLHRASHQAVLVDEPLGDDDGGGRAVRGR